MIKNILLSFIPLFVAVDAIGVMPMFVALTNELGQKEKTRIILQSMLTAASLAVGFVLVGKLLFRWLGITIGDFMIAGGAILFSLAIRKNLRGQAYLFAVRNLRRSLLRPLGRLFS